MKFYIVTPTYNSIEWIQRCVCSVAEQVEAGVDVHHHVQDGGSADGTTEFLKEWQKSHADMVGYTFTWESARDSGMYDAINKAWEKMPQDSDVTAHLNADEQYLPHALRGVADGFAQNGSADVLLGSYFVLDVKSRYICHRRPVTPWNWVSQTVCEIITCATFHRVSTFRQHGKRFDTQWRIIGDLVHYRDILSTGPRFAVLPRLFTSVFTVTGNNLGWAEAVADEVRRYRATLSAWYCRVGKLAHFVANVKRRACNIWYPAPHEYEIFMPDDCQQRVRRTIKSPTSHWGCRQEGESE